jgi:hypothetical protein
MRWYHFVTYFFGGVLLANTLPHLGNGVSGHVLVLGVGILVMSVILARRLGRFHGGL